MVCLFTTGSDQSRFPSSESMRLTEGRTSSAKGIGHDATGRRTSFIFWVWPTESPPNETWHEWQAEHLFKFHESFPAPDFSTLVFCTWLQLPNSAPELSHRSIVVGSVAMFAVLIVLFLWRFGTPQTYKLAPKSESKLVYCNSWIQWFMHVMVGTSS